MKHFWTIVGVAFFAWLAAAYTGLFDQAPPAAAPITETTTPEIVDPFKERAIVDPFKEPVVVLSAGCPYGLVPEGDGTCNSPSNIAYNERERERHQRRQDAAAFAHDLARELDNAARNAH